MNKADICGVILKLENDATVPLTHEALEAYDEFDKTITKIMIHAAKKCRKLFMEGVLFSPKLAQHLNIINYRRLINKKGEFALICAQSCNRKNL